MLCKVSISSCSKHCPQALLMASHTHSFLSIPTAQQGNQGPEGQLHVTGGLWRAELRDCYPFYGRAKNNSAFHWDITVRRENTQFPCEEWGVIHQGQYCTLGIAYTLLGCFFPLPPPFAVANSGCGKCVHTAQSAASTPEEAQPEKQCQETSCQAGRSAELLPCHSWRAQGLWPSKGHGLGFSSPRSHQKT